MLLSNGHNYQQSWTIAEQISSKISELKCSKLVNSRNSSICKGDLGNSRVFSNIRRSSSFLKIRDSMLFVHIHLPQCGWFVSISMKDFRVKWFYDLWLAHYTGYPIWMASACCKAMRSDFLIAHKSCNVIEFGSRG